MPTPPALPPTLYRSMTPPGAVAPAAAYPTTTGPATIEVTINGALYRWQGTATFAGGLWAPAGAVWTGKWALVNPAPKPSAVTGYADSTGIALTTVSPGQVFVIQGRGFGPLTGQARLDPGSGSTVPFALAITAWSETAVRVMLPTTGAFPASATVTLQLPSGAQITGPVLTVRPPPPMPGPSPVPTPVPLPGPGPVINGYQGMTQGAAPATFAAGQTVQVIGTGFGAAPGTVQLQAALVPASFWSDTEVDFIVPLASPTSSTPRTVTVTRADGKYYTSTGIVVAQALASPPEASNEADPLPAPWAGEIPTTVETQPFTVNGKSFCLLMKLTPGTGPGSFTVNGQSVAVAITPVPVLLLPAAAANGARARPSPGTGKSGFHPPPR